ncbi:hypothetical protein L598_001500000140 [Mesorhizobium sp. J18]|uniref:DUF6456 domain-containing protein n=1 Tax=Mesorhizobium sp. J18 TaxID=935263 RepID=UPI00119B17BE|nr:DUF6456 domain-containing protein [Mesorhizobium sp. J18]TWG99291.1 hypothetical protein L598_001500000140 [Mesorhizobium sp. J18]
MTAGMKREDRSSREKMRVSRFLAAGPATIAVAGSGDNLLLETENRGTISVRRGEFRALLAQGLVVVSGKCARLSAEGQALARRAAATVEPFRAQHGETGSVVMEVQGMRETVEINLAESPLAQLASRRTRKGERFLTGAEIRAGERLRADYTRGQIMPRITANWQAAVASGRRAGGSGGMVELTDAALAARQRVDRALQAVGPELAGVLVDVCCFLKGLERVETERGWPVRSAKVVLKTALGALSRHYEPHLCSGSQSRPILHWGAEGYRPKIMG